MVERFKSVLKR